MFAVPKAPTVTSVVPTITSAALARLLVDATAAKLKRTSRRGLRRGPIVRLYAGSHTVITIKVVTCRRASTITFARARVVFTGAGVRSVRLKPTAAGRRALAQRGTLALRARATVTPTAAKPASASALARV